MTVQPQVFTPAVGGYDVVAYHDDTADIGSQILLEGCAFSGIHWG